MESTQLTDKEAPINPEAKADHESSQVSRSTVKEVTSHGR